jgi:3-phytase
VNRLVLFLALVAVVIACNRNAESSDASGPDSWNPDNEAWEDSIKYNLALRLQSNIKKSVTADVETTEVKASPDQDSADDPAIFTVGMSTYIAGSNKTCGIHFYDISGAELAYFDYGLINNVDARTIITDQKDTLTIVGGSNRTDNTLIFIVAAKNSELMLKDSVVYSLETDLAEVYGFCLYYDYEDNKLFAFANSKEGRIGQWLLEFSGSTITGEKVRDMLVLSQPEGMVADDRTGKLYLGEERKGIHVFDAGQTGSGISRIIPGSDSTNTSISYDIEGLAVYPEEEDEGYLIASSQGNFSYAVFDLKKEIYLFSFKISDGSFDGVEETDGLELYPGYVNDKFPEGIFVVQDGFNYDHKLKKAQNFKLIDWRKIATLIEDFHN